jgi:hypothetical protein
MHGWPRRFTERWSCVLYFVRVSECAQLQRSELLCVLVYVCLYFVVGPVFHEPAYLLFLAILTFGSIQIPSSLQVVIFHPIEHCPKRPPKADRETHVASKTKSSKQKK